MSGSKRACNQDGCDRSARPRGPECRQCYKKLHKRERRAQKRFEDRMLSLDDNTFAVNRKWYDLWAQEQD